MGLIETFISSKLCMSLYERTREAYIRKLSAETKRMFASLGENAYIEYPWNRLHGLGHVHIGEGFHANKGLFLGAYGVDRKDPQIMIGNNVVINFNCQITAISGVTIGDDVLTGSHVLITDHYHGEISADSLSLPPIYRALFSRGEVEIGNRVWIGSGAAILPGVEIGDDCIIGANSVVTKSFSARSVVAGNPAKLIKVL